MSPQFCIVSVQEYLTCCPSATLFSLTLGPDLPWEDQLYPGNLRHSAYMILTYISLLIPAFSLPFRPRNLTVSLRPHGMLLYRPQIQSICGLKASVTCLSPVYLRRKTSRPVSCYALFECMAASKPTSWLSVKSHILFHLTRI